MHNCAGWATTGGPWITPELAMQKLVSSEVTVEGGRTIREKLPQPEVTRDHYRDIAVFVIPASATGLEIDKLRREGMDVHWKHGLQPLLDHLGPLVGKTFKHLTIDSYEAGLHHGTPRMREEFTTPRPTCWL